MNRFYAPGRCPDCDAPSSPQEARCPSCGLLLTGQVADDLRASLQYADRVLDVLRRVSAAETVAVPAQSAPAASVPAMPPRPPATARLGRGLPAVSVPVVLLGLGTICVLVAAIVFVAVTWTDLSLAWRTTILLSITALATAAAAWTVRKGLRGAAEALALVASGLLLIDLLAGNSAGLPVLSALDGTAFGWLVALVMAGSGLAWALWAQRTAARSLVGQQVVAALASIEMTRLAALGWDHDTEWLAVIVAVGSAALGLLLWRIRLRTLAVAEGVVALIAWVYLATSGAVRAVAADGTRELFLDLQGAPLLAASALAAVVAVVRRPRPWVRTAAAALAVAGPVTIALLPARELSPTAAAVIVALAALALALAATVSPGPWRDGLRWVMAVTALVPAVSLAVGMELAVGRLVSGVEEYWTRALTDSLPALAVAPPVASWAWVPLGGVLAASAAVGLLRRARTVLAAAAGGAAAGAALGLLLTGWPLVVVNVVLAAAAAGGVTALVRRGDDWWWSGGIAVTVVLGVAAATPSATATIAFFGVHAVLLFVVAGLLRGPARSGLVFTGLVLQALSLQAVGDVARLSAATTGLLVLGLAVVAAVVAQGTRMGTDRRSWRRGLEASATLLAAVAVAQTATEDVALTIALTVSGAVVIVVSFLSADRRRLAWVGSVLLVLASWVRLNALDVDVVEAYTLPGAVALLVAGLVWIRRTPSATSWQALGAPLALGLGPSLAVALDEPTSPRALLVGIVGLALVLAGARAGWGAPLLVGGAAVGALAVVNIAPYAEALPRWILFGTAGVALLALGVTWEQRRQNLAAVHRYATRLR